MRFDYLTAPQRAALFVREAVRLGVASEEAAAWGERTRALDRLTPGDYAAAVKRLRLLGEPVSGERLWQALQEELVAKGGPRRRVGF